MFIKLRFVLLSMLIIAIGLPLLFCSFRYYKIYENKKYYERVQVNSRVYIYDTLTYDSKEGVLSPAFYVEDIKYKNDLVSWYKGEEFGKNLPIPFPINCTMPFIRPVFLINYSKDSLVAEVVDFNTSCWGHIQGWVYYKTVHKYPPPDRLTKKYEAYFNGLKTDNINNPPSSYGCQCW